MIDRKASISRNELALGISVSKYLRHVGFRPHPWQDAVSRTRSKRVILNCARQAGKSTFVSAIPCHAARFYPGSLNIVIAPTEDQASEDMLKIKDFMAHDPDYPPLVRDSAGLITLSNGSRIKIVVATDKAARGYSKPRTIMLDEASRIPDVVYKSGVRPMLTNNPDCDVYILSTPFGEEGFFYETWTSRSTTFDKYEVRSPWDPDPENPEVLLPAIPEEEFARERATRGIKGFYSPQHANLEEQTENLQAMGIRQYRQEYCCEFVEAGGAVFSYETLHRLFHETVPLEKTPSHDPGMTYRAMEPRKIGGRWF